MKYIREKIRIQIILIVCFGSLFSCTKDLDRLPPNSTTNTELYSTPDGYKQSLVTTYSTLSYDDARLLRQYWNMQEITTDEAVATWDDPEGTLSFNKLEWTADNTSIEDVYNTVMYNITLCNNFIIESAEDVVAQRGFSIEDASTIKQYQAECRFIRAYYYWIMMDLFGNPPFATEETLRNREVPKQIKRPDLYQFIIDELIAIDQFLPEPQSNEYGRADKAAAWSLLARVYLNANVYAETDAYAKALEYSEKVIKAGYTLENNHNWLFLGDNHLNTNEFIFAANYDNEHLITWGGTNYLALGAAGVSAEVNGLSGSWNSFRLTPSITALFPSLDTLIDKRATIWTEGQSLEIKHLGNSKQGYSSFKFRNLNRAGERLPQNNVYNNISDIDFPIFRLAEMYLIYAESNLRGGGGSKTTALSYINKLRGRAYDNDPGSTAGNIGEGELTLNFIIDERVRELFWETHRRTDLIRYERFTGGNYLWTWKGGVQKGVAVDSKYRLFPIPLSEILSNPNLKQNKGY